MKYKIALSLFIISCLISINTINAFSLPTTPLVDVEFIDHDKNSLSDNNLETIEPILSEIFSDRNNAILNLDIEPLKKFYDLNKKQSLWAYENEIKKIKYLKGWSEKQGINFTDIKSRIKIKKIKEKEKGLYGTIAIVSTEYHYKYLNSEEDNFFKLGTYHYFNIKKNDDGFLIAKEWYTDPFADSLELNDLKSEEIKNFILSKTKPEVNLSEKLTKAINYAHIYCGAASDNKNGFKYNSKYTDFNSVGGDCANFASQILHEGGGFKKNKTWNYSDGDGTKAWVNAQGFKNYMVSSGRASYIAKGPYHQIYKAAYNMRPGDFVAYEKEGRITHISTVTGLDSKGYPLVTCHNTDRLLVPYDLGWSNSNITFHLIHVHY